MPSRCQLIRRIELPPRRKCASQLALSGFCMGIFWPAGDPAARNNCSTIIGAAGQLPDTHPELTLMRNVSAQ